MTPQEKEIADRAEAIKNELRNMFETNLKVFDWNIPENDDKTSAQLIAKVLQEELEEIKKDIAAGKYDNY